MTLWHSISIFLERLPTFTIEPRSSRKSPACTGCLNSIMSWAARSPSSPSYSRSFSGDVAEPFHHSASAIMPPP